MLIDISRPLSAGTAVWPGDRPTTLTRVATLAGDTLVNCHELNFSLHAATHLDAPFHYDTDGQTVDELDLSLLAGPCTVVVLPRPCPDPMTDGDLRAALVGLTLHSRVLLATGAWTDSSVFPREFPILTLEAARFLGASGVKLLGLDVPSVDKFPAATIPLHLELNRLGILILESLDLTGVVPGEYELLALPLRIPGAEASPVRAVLRRISISR